MRRVANIVIALSIVAVVCAGCSSGEKYKPAQKASGEMEAAAKHLTQTQADVGATISAMNNLVSSSGGDLRSKYDAFSKSLKKLNESAKETSKQADAMKAKGQAYFAKWDQEAAAIKNEDIRARSDARRAEVQKQFDTVSALYQQAKTEFVPFQSDLNDIHRALGNDLTSGGLASVRDIVSRASTEGATLQTTIGKLADEFRSLGLKISPSGK